jgi:cytochrome c-type biogenesis protein
LLFPVAIPRTFLASVCAFRPKSSTILKMDNISPLVAFTGGLLSLFSPCVLPLIPVYMASLAGPEIYRTGVKGRRLSVFFHALSFVIGFSAIFILLGTGAGAIGLAISSHLFQVRRIAGSLMIVFGISMLAALRVPWLNYEKRLTAKQSTTTGYLRSFIIGVLFALAWTPCVGLVLGGILTLAFNTQSVWQGSYLLAIYSVGLGIPLLLIGLLFDSLLPWMKKIARYSLYIYIFSGLLLLAVGILILINRLSWFSF